MNKIILACAMLLPATAVGRPNVNENRVSLENAVLDPGPPVHPDFTCSTGGPTSMLAGVAVLGLLARRRR